MLAWAPCGRGASEGCLTTGMEEAGPLGWGAELGKAQAWCPPAPPLGLSGLSILALALCLWSPQGVCLPNQDWPMKARMRALSPVPKGTPEKASQAAQAGLRPSGSAKGWHKAPSEDVEGASLGRPALPIQASSWEKPPFAGLAAHGACLPKGFSPQPAHACRVSACPCVRTFYECPSLCRAPPSSCNLTLLTSGPSESGAQRPPHRLLPPQHPPVPLHASHPACVPSR